MTARTHGHRACRGALGCDQGSAPAATIAWTAVAALMLGIVLALGAAHAARSQASAAADLAALSAADSLAFGGPACHVAAQVAAANKAHLTQCVVHGEVVSVEVTYPVQVPFTGQRNVTARATAGPQPPITSPTARSSDPGELFVEASLDLTQKA